MNTVREIEAALRSLVARIPAASKPNGFSIADFREATAECLADVRADDARFGSAEQPFWNLLMYDSNPAVKALFLVTILTPEHLRVCAGEGIPSEVVASCERFAMSEVSGFTAEFEARYSIGANSFDIPRPLAEYWLAAT